MSWRLTLKPYPAPIRDEGELLSNNVCCVYDSETKEATFIDEANDMEVFYIETVEFFSIGQEFMHLIGYVAKDDNSYRRVEVKLHRRAMYDVLPKGKSDE